MAEKLNTKKVAYATAGVFAALYVICAVAFVLAPGAVMSLANNLFHGVDLSKIADNTMTIGGFVIGLVQVAVYGLLAGWIFTGVYNRTR